MNRAFQYTNRMGDCYFLQSNIGKGGKRKYSFPRKLKGEPAEQLPEGYEVREDPDTGQVVVRKIRPSVIRLEEKRLLEEMIRKQTNGLMFIVDVEESALVVYTSNMNEDVRIDALRSIVPMDIATAREVMHDALARARFQKMMRFTLTDVERRLFKMDRWCFRGSIDNWYLIDGDQPLKALARKYVGHLGEESFFDLM